jgi:hypothetical protein
MSWVSFLSGRLIYHLLGSNIGNLLSSNRKDTADNGLPLLVRAKGVVDITCWDSNIGDFLSSNRKDTANNGSPPLVRAKEIVELIRFVHIIGLPSVRRLLRLSTLLPLLWKMPLHRWSGADMQGLDFA